MKAALTPTFYIVVALALVVSFGIDLANTLNSGAIDLRNRITGVRLMEAGIDPYRYKWTYGDPDIYCDVHNNPHSPLSKTTVTPALLILHAAPAILPYRAAEFVWLAVQWLLLLGTGWLWLRVCTEDWHRAAIAIFLTGYTYTAAWRLHAERGQCYVLLGFVFAAWLVLTLSRTTGRHWAIGTIAGLLIALRPPFALVVPFLALHRRAQLIGVALGLVVGVGAPMLVQSNCWSDYSSAMETFSGLYRNDINDGSQPSGPQRYPGELEGTSTRLIGKNAEIPFADFSFFQMLRALGIERSWLGDQAWPAWPGILLFAFGFMVWLVLTRRREPELLLAALAGWVYLTDLFLPAFRNSYGDVLMLDVIAAGVVLGTTIPWGLWPCAIALPFGLLVYVEVPRQDPIINIPTALLVISAVAFVVATRPIALSFFFPMKGKADDKRRKTPSIRAGKSRN